MVHPGPFLIPKKEGRYFGPYFGSPRWQKAGPFSYKKGRPFLPRSLFWALALRAFRGVTNTVKRCMKQQSIMVVLSLRHTFFKQAARGTTPCSSRQQAEEDRIHPGHCHLDRRRALGDGRAALALPHIVNWRRPSRALEHGKIQRNTTVYDQSSGRQWPNISAAMTLQRVFWSCLDFSGDLPKKTYLGGYGPRCMMCRARVT